MKQEYIDTLTMLMRKHKDIITLTADMGFSVYENMQKEFPTRFINTGVTEQATVSFAAGLALTGFKVFFYAQAAFATMRCFEQVRLDLGYNFLNVKVIGVNAGFSLNQLGVSHFAQEDIGLMRLIPGMTIFSPGDPIEMKWVVKRAYEINGPVYIRFSKLGTKTIHHSEKELKDGEPIPILKGTDGIFFVSGGLLETAFGVTKRLKKNNIHLSLYSMPTVKPIKKEKIINILKGHSKAFVLEEHSIIGGLGSAISEIIASKGLPISIIRLGIPDRYTSVTGSMPYLLDYNGLSEKKLILAITKNLQNLKC